MNSLQRPIFLDLFCGCGGFTLGMQRAGFDCLAAIDFNPDAMKTFRANLPEVPHALEKDLTLFSPEELSRIIGRDYVDVIIGGPPCQGFSTARQRDGANQGKRLIEDPRRHLYQEFLKHVKFFQPKIFVIENVLGIRSADSGVYFQRLQSEARELGYRVHPQMENAFELGVPQKRKRQLFIGTRIDLIHYFHGQLERVPRAVEHPSLWEAIGDLPPLQAGEGFEMAEYDMERRQLHVERFGKNFIYNVLEVHKSADLGSHCARPHSERDLRDFVLLREGESSAEAMRRGVVFEFPYDKENFKDRYTRQHRREPCSTIVAHLSKDGLMFIHPTQNRSLSPREAARVQTFPDWFKFPVSRTQQFRMIGNAVPPLVGESIGLTIKKYLEKVSATAKQKKSPQNLPGNRKHALEKVREVVDVSNKRLIRNIVAEDFKCTWFSIEFLYPELHPIGALDSNARLSKNRNMWRRVDSHLSLPCCEDSGWPVALIPVVKEAWRRYKTGELKEFEFYCSEVASEGIRQHALSLKRSDKMDGKWDEERNIRYLESEVSCS